MIIAQQNNSWKIQLQTNVGLQSWQYFSSNKTQYSNIQEFNIDHTAKIDFGSKINIRLGLRGLLNTRNERRNRIVMNEAYLRVVTGPITTNIGNQKIKWGGLTGLSARDLSNTYDYFDFLSTQEELLGSLGIQSQITLSNHIQVTLRAFRYNTSSRIYNNKSRWVEDLPPLTNPDNPMSPFIWKEDNSIEIWNRKKPTIGIDVDMEIGTMNANASWYYGNNDIPKYYIDNIRLEEDVALYQLNLNFHEVMISALSLSTYLGRWNVWTELSHTRNQKLDTNKRLSPDNYSNFTFGLDRVFNFEDPEKKVTLVCQYWTTLGQEDSYETINLDHIFSNNLMVDIKYQLNYYWSLNLRSAKELGNKGFYANPSLRWKISDYTSLAWSFDILMGDETNFFGHYRTNTRSSLAFKYYFHN